MDSVISQPTTGDPPSKCMSVKSRTVQVTLPRVNNTPYTHTDLLATLKENNIHEQDIEAIGTFKSNIVWHICFYDFEIVTHLLSLPCIHVRSNVALVEPAGARTLKLRIHWAHYWVSDHSITEALENIGCTVLNNYDEVYSGTNIKTMVRIFLVKTQTPSSIPHFLRLADDTELFMTFRGRKPICLRCKQVGHVSKDCSPKHHEIMQINDVINDTSCRDGGDADHDAPPVNNAGSCGDVDSNQNDNAKTTFHHPNEDDARDGDACGVGAGDDVACGDGAHDDVCDVGACGGVTCAGDARGDDACDVNEYDDRYEDQFDDDDDDDTVDRDADDGDGSDAGDGTHGDACPGAGNAVSDDAGGDAANHCAGGATGWRFSLDQPLRAGIKVLTTRSRDINKGTLAQSINKRFDDITKGQRNALMMYMNFKNPGAHNESLKNFLRRKSSYELDEIYQDARKHKIAMSIKF
jgi:hypothetical protein